MPFVKMAEAVPEQRAEAIPEQKFGDGLEMLFVDAPFDESVKAIKAAGGEVALPQQVAQARLVAPFNSHVWQYGAYTAGNVIYIPKKRINIWTLPPYSPIMTHPVEATLAHRTGDYSVPEAELAEILRVAEEDKGKSPLEQRVHVETRVKDFGIKTSKLAEDALAQYLLKEDAPAYAGKLQKAEILEVPVILVDDFEQIAAQSDAFARALWLRLAYGRSGVVGGNGGLGCGGGARGVRRVAPLGAASADTYETIAR